MDLFALIVTGSLFLISALLTILLVPLVIHIAHRYAIIDRPDGLLKIHEQPTPYLGGLAVFLGFLLPSLLVFYAILALANFSDLSSLPHLSARLYALVFTSFYGGIFFLLVLGLVDDLYRLTSSTKWLGQIAIMAVFFVPSALLFTTPAGALLYAIWALAVVNMFNLVDVMDGLATTLALCAAVSLLVVRRPDLWSIIAPAFAGALAGFLLFNRPPAKIYLGDAGSLLLGGICAQAPLFFIADHYFETGIKLDVIQMFIQFVVPGFILLIPALEVFTLIMVRWHKGIPFYQGSHDHFIHYLLRKGWSKNGILLYVSFLSLILFWVAWLFTAGFIGVPLLLFCATLFVGFWYFVLFLV